ncbi:39079_t:CDS:2 [Gigaspora margarita]|uniref:39079_t:CDS:1 n=1 Tax=Gigaspora margarita TaxID=4874 RepID=A0ABN7U2L3_GIGMA|nr:39079_t:CDS:2 [Gigaspora margarita]
MHAVKKKIYIRARTKNCSKSHCKNESLSSESFAKSSLLLTNKQTTSVTLPNREFWFALPMNESDFVAVEDNTYNTINIDNNDTQQNSGKNTIKADAIEADDNDTQQYSGLQAISDNNNSIPKSKTTLVYNN